MTSTPNGASEELKIDIDKLFVYLNGKDFPDKASYKLIPSDNDNGNRAWYVECSISGTGTNNSAKPLYSNANSSECKSVKKKLAGRAKSVVS